MPLGVFWPLGALPSVGGTPTPRRTDSRIVRPWLTRPAAISPRPSEPLRTVTLAPCRPTAASLTICGTRGVSSWSGGARVVRRAPPPVGLVDLGLVLPPDDGGLPPEPRLLAGRGLHRLGRRLVGRRLS